MKIGIDARFVGPGGTGLGKYTEKLIENLAKIDKKNDYVIFLQKANWNYLKFSANFQKSLANIPWYSVSEQIRLPTIFARAKLDLLHVPHFNVPIFYPHKFIVTIHDLIHHHFAESTATTRNPWTFKLKKFAYRQVINNAVKKSVKIITPSNFVKNEIVKNFKIDSSKIVVTYEAAEEEYFSVQRLAFSIQQPYIIYVGNAYPHKNLERLLDAIKIINSKNYSSSERSESRSSRQARTIIKLVFVCPRDVFWQRLQSEIKQRQLEDSVELKGYLKPQDLVKLFARARAYVFPSLSEGFGIPGLNAMAAGLPVVCSNTPTLKEVYQDAALYFDPGSPNDIAKKIHRIISDNKTRSDLIKKGRAQVQKYSWQKMAQETLDVYNNTVIKNGK